MFCRPFIVLYLLAIVLSVAIVLTVLLFTLPLWYLQTFLAGNSTLQILKYPVYAKSSSWNCVQCLWTYKAINGIDQIDPCLPKVKGYHKHFNVIIVVSLLCFLFCLYFLNYMCSTHTCVLHNWNSVVSGVKHHTSNPVLMCSILPSLHYNSSLYMWLCMFRDACTVD